MSYADQLPLRLPAKLRDDIQLLPSPGSVVDGAVLEPTIEALQRPRPPGRQPRPPAHPPTVASPNGDQQVSAG